MTRLSGHFEGVQIAEDVPDQPPREVPAAGPGLAEGAMSNAVVDETMQFYCPQWVRESAATGNSERSRKIRRPDGWQALRSSCKNTNEM